MPVIDLLDRDYVIYALRNNVPRSQIYRREYERLKTMGVTEHWTEGVIANFARKYRAGQLNVTENEIITLPRYVYGIDPPIIGGIPIFTGHEHLEGNWLVISDLHIPIMDNAWFEKAMRTAKEHGLTNVLLAGDLLDSRPASQWPDLVPAYSQDLESAVLSSVTHYLADNFERVVYMPGNHDRWYIKKAGGSMTFEGMIGDFVKFLPDNLIVTEYDRVYIDSDGVEWMVPHQRNYSNKSGSVAQKLINKYRTNVIIPHQHYSGLYVDEWGYNHAIEIGGLMLIPGVAYANMTTSTSRPMQNGYAMVKDGIGTLFYNGLVESRVV